MFNNADLNYLGGLLDSIGEIELYRRIHKQNGIIMFKILPRIKFTFNNFTTTSKINDLFNGIGFIYEKDDKFYYEINSKQALEFLKKIKNYTLIKTDYVKFIENLKPIFYKSSDDVVDVFKLFNSLNKYGYDSSLVDNNWFAGYIEFKWDICCKKINNKVKFYIKIEKENISTLSTDYVLSIYKKIVLFMRVNSWQVILLITYYETPEKLSSANNLYTLFMKEKENPFNLDTYQELAKYTAIYPEKDKITYPALGLCGETGEVANKVKKIIRDDSGVLSYEKKKDIESELSDCFWYLAALSTDLKSKMSDLTIENINKLYDRKIRNVIGGSGDKR